MVTHRSPIEQPAWAAKMRESAFETTEPLRRGEAGMKVVSASDRRLHGTSYTAAAAFPPGDSESRQAEDGKAGGFGHRGYQAFGDERPLHAEFHQHRSLRRPGYGLN